MRKGYTTILNLKHTDIALLFLRVAVAGMMLTHGIPKLLRLFGPDPKFGDPLGLGVEASLTLVVFAEFLCSILIFIGLATRLAAIPLILAMSVAVFIAHAGDPFQRKELALLYLVVFIFFMLTGAGKYSLDHYFLKKKKEKE